MEAALALDTPCVCGSDCKCIGLTATLLDSFAATARREALEEAAKVVENSDIRVDLLNGHYDGDNGRGTLDAAAARIRALLAPSGERSGA